MERKLHIEMVVVTFCDVSWSWLPDEKRNTEPYGARWVDHPPTVRVNSCLVVCFRAELVKCVWDNVFSCKVLICRVVALGTISATAFVTRVGAMWCSSITTCSK